MEANPTQIGVGLVFEVLITVGLAAWGRWVARRRGNEPFWRFAALAPWISLGLVALGTAIGVVLLNRVFDAIKGVDAAQRQRVLAAGIAEAMNASAMFLIPGYALLLFALVAFTVGSLSSPRGAP